PGHIARAGGGRVLRTVETMDQDYENHASVRISCRPPGFVVHERVRIGVLPDLWQRWIQPSPRYLRRDKRTDKKIRSCAVLCFVTVRPDQPETGPRTGLIPDRGQRCQGEQGYRERERRPNAAMPTGQYNETCSIPASASRTTTVTAVHCYILHI